MRFAELRRSHAFVSFLLFCLAVLTGWSTFNLQLISLVRLLQEAGITVLPSLMILQAGLSWLLLRAWGNAAQGSTTKFFSVALVTGMGVVVVAHWPTAAFFSSAANDAHSDWKLFGLLYILSQLCIAALRMGVHVTFSKWISLLRNPQVSIQLAIAEESGFLIGVLLLIAMPTMLGFATLTVSILPFALGFGVFTLIRICTQSRERFQQKRMTDQKLIDRLKAVSLYFNPLSKAAPASNQFATRMPPYLPWLIGLFTVTAFLKALQWFGMAYGLSEASRDGGDLLVTIFSRLSLVQSCLTLTILLASLRFASKIPTWSLGFRVLLTIQGLVGCVLTGMPTPYLLMSGEVLRKVLEHGFLGRSLQLLTSSVPDEQRLETRHLMEKWSTTSGTALAGIMAFFVIHGWLHIALFCTTAVVLAILGLRLRKRLFSTLNDFHLAQLNQERLAGVIQACYVLANPESRQHHAALTGILERNPRPAVTKAMLHSLGRMQHNSGMPAITRYLESNREDIQLAAVKALLNFSGHQLNLVMLKTLRTLIRADMAIRVSVVRLLTHRLGKLAVPYLLEVLDTPTNERVAANAVEILGEIAHDEQDEDLMDFLSKYLEGDHGRRVRANAIVTLYDHKKHGSKALEAFDRFLTSSDPKEQDSAAYIAGRLDLRGHESFIWRRSEQQNHQNTVLLVALLRLKNPEAPALLAQWVVGENEAVAHKALVRLSAVPENRRAKVFYELVERWAPLLDIALVRMRASQRDFESDRELIREEARRLGITLAEEEAWGGARTASRLEPNNDRKPAA